MNKERDQEDALALEILHVIDQHQNMSQRPLAWHLGGALGLANSYLKRCIRKGPIKVSPAPLNRYLYCLLPQGFAEKSQLTAQYVNYLLSSLSQRRRIVPTSLSRRRGEPNGWRRLLPYGISGLVEITTVRVNEHAALASSVFAASTASGTNFWATPWRRQPRRTCTTSAPLSLYLIRALACPSRELHRPQTPMY